MSETAHTHGLGRVSNDIVWRYTKLIFLTSALIFLVNIALGFLNVFTPGEIPRWQLLVHLHSGTLGWITLSVFGAAVWLFTGGRAVSDADANRVRWLARLMIAAFLALIASFGIAYSQGGNAFYLMAVFAPLAALTIWAATIFFLRQLGRLAVTTTAHLLVAAGFFAAALAVTLGTVVALGRAEIVPINGGVPIVGHITGIETYLILVSTGVIEWIVLQERAGQWTRAGIVQVGLGTLLGFIGPVAFLLTLAGVPGSSLAMPMNLVFLVGMVLFGLLFLGRIGHRALRVNPLTAGVGAWTFFATFWYVGGVVLWPLRLALGDPAWWVTVYAHVVFVGVMTNLLLGVLSARSRSAEVGYTWAEPAATWLINGGMVVFFALFLALDSTHGALVMGTGVILGVGLMLLSLRETGGAAGTPADTGVETMD